MANDTPTQREAVQPEILPTGRPPIGHQLEISVNRTSIEPDRRPVGSRDSVGHCDGRFYT